MLDELLKYHETPAKDDFTAPGGFTLEDSVLGHSHVEYVLVREWTPS